MHVSYRLDPDAHSFMHIRIQIQIQEPIECRSNSYRDPKHCRDLYQYVHRYYLYGKRDFEWKDLDFKLNCFDFS
jgi:hypothetical protein